MTPSYYRLMADLMAQRGFDHPIWASNDKISNRELGALAGVHVPNLLQGPCSLRRITPPSEPAVIKPVYGCSARGVVPLMPSGDGYIDPRTRGAITWDEAVAQALADKHLPRNLRLVQIGHPDAMRPPWLLEQMVIDPASGGLPADWKGYCVAGRVVVTLQCRRARSGQLSVQWWDREWNALGDIKPHPRYMLDESLRPPRRPADMVEAMEAVAQLVDSPFIRVDLYEDVDGPVFGEVTPVPTGNTLRFVPEWDRRLGEAWLAAL